MSGDPYPDFNPALQKLIDGNTTLQAAYEQLCLVEKEQQKLADYANQLIGLVEEMQIKRDTWRNHAVEMEKDRNRWQHQAEENDRLLRIARRRAVDLAAEADRIHCPNCASPAVEVWPIEEAAVLKCAECGYREEATP